MKPSDYGSGFAERLKTAAEARKALIEGLRAKPSVSDPDFQHSSVRKAAELQQVRLDRADAKRLKQAAAAEAVAQAQAAEAAAADAALADKRGARKERKALTKAEAKAKRDARYAARKARA